MSEKPMEKTTVVLEGAEGEIVRVEPLAGPCIWIVAASSEEYGRRYLAGYAGQFERDVQRRVMDGAMRERFDGTLSERLAYLNWEIVCVRLQEVTSSA